MTKLSAFDGTKCVFLQTVTAVWCAVKLPEQISHAGVVSKKMNGLNYFRRKGWPWFIIYTVLYGNSGIFKNKDRPTWNPVEQPIFLLFATAVEFITLSVHLRLQYAASAKRCVVRLRQTSLVVFPYCFRRSTCWCRSGSASWVALTMCRPNIVGVCRSISRRTATYRIAA